MAKPKSARKRNRAKPWFRKAERRGRVDIDHTTMIPQHSQVLSEGSDVCIIPLSFIETAGEEYQVVEEFLDAYRTSLQSASWSIASGVRLSRLVINLAIREEAHLDASFTYTPAPPFEIKVDLASIDPTGGSPHPFSTYEGNKGNDLDTEAIICAEFTCRDLRTAAVTYPRPTWGVAVNDAAKVNWLRSWQLRFPVRIPGCRSYLAHDATDDRQNFHALFVSIRRPKEVLANESITWDLTGRVRAQLELIPNGSNRRRRA